MNTPRVAIGLGLLGVVAAATYLLLAGKDDLSAAAVDRTRAVDIEMGLAALSTEMGLARLQDTYPSLYLVCRANDQMIDVMGDQICVAPVANVNRLPAATTTFHLKDKQLIAMRLTVPPTAHESWLEYLDRHYAARHALKGQVDGNGVPLVGWRVMGGTVLAGEKASSEETAILWLGKNTVAHAAIAPAQVVHAEVGARKSVQPAALAREEKPVEMARSRPAERSDPRRDTAETKTPVPAVVTLDKKDQNALSDEMRAHDEARARKQEAVKMLVRKLAEQRRGEVFE